MLSEVSEAVQSKHFWSLSAIAPHGRMGTCEQAVMSGQVTTFGSHDQTKLNFCRRALCHTHLSSVPKTESIAQKNRFARVLHMRRSIRYFASIFFALLSAGYRQLNERAKWKFVKRTLVSFDGKVITITTTIKSLNLFTSSKVWLFPSGKNYTRFGAALNTVRHVMYSNINLPRTSTTVRLYGILSKLNNLAESLAAPFHKAPGVQSH